MPASRRLWDSSVVIGYLAGDQRIYPVCPQIIRRAELRETEILVSQMAIVETAYLKGISDTDSARLIKEFFSREYIIPVSVDGPVSSLAQDLVRKYRSGPRIKPPVQFTSQLLFFGKSLFWKQSMTLSFVSIS